MSNAGEGEDGSQNPIDPILFGLPMLNRWRAALCVLLALFCVAATELAEALRSPDSLLLMRHAYAPVVGDPPTTSWSVVQATG